jgi:hypothetical protein
MLRYTFGPIVVPAGHAARQGAPRGVVPVSTTRGLGAMGNATVNTATAPPRRG